MTALHTMGVAAVAELVRRREISPVEVVEACLARLETLELQLQAWVTVDRHGALAAAKQCEQAVQRGDRVGQLAAQPARSEEHTSELQSQSNLVCRLLLEKKKKNNITRQYIKKILTSKS